MKKLFDDLEKEWEKEWVGMPEFIQKDKEPCQKIIVNFETYEDVLMFAKFLNFNVTKKTKTIWFPIKEKDKPKEYAYVDKKK
jgi:hypothetical protein